MQNLKEKLSGKKGLTLIEMLSATAIIAILTAASIPTASTALSRPAARRQRTGVEGTGLHPAPLLSILTAQTPAAQRHRAERRLSQRSYFIRNLTNGIPGRANPRF